MKGLAVSKPKAQPVAGMILAALATLLLVGVGTFAGPCGSQGGQDAPSCQWASRAVLGGGVVAHIIAIVRIFETDEGERRGLSLACGLLGLLVATMPGLVIDLCADPAMHCNAVMRPFVVVMGVAMSVAGTADVTRRLLAIRANPADSSWEDVAGGSYDWPSEKATRTPDAW